MLTLDKIRILMQYNIIKIIKFIFLWQKIKALEF